MRPMALRNGRSTSASSRSCVRRMATTGSSGFVARTSWSFRARDTAGPLADGDFLRTGGALSLSVQGAHGTLLERLNLDLANKYLYGITGPLEHFNRFDATLSYLLPGSDRYRLGVNYTIGRSDDTLQYQDYWSTVLGVRF
jgi:hypothetical protein